MKLENVQLAFSSNSSKIPNVDETQVKSFFNFTAMFFDYLSSSWETSCAKNTQFFLL